MQCIKRLVRDIRLPKHHWVFLLLQSDCMLGTKIPLTIYINASTNPSVVALKHPVTLILSFTALKYVRIYLLNEFY